MLWCPCRPHPQPPGSPGTGAPSRQRVGGPSPGGFCSSRSHRFGFGEGCSRSVLRARPGRESRGRARCARARACGKASRTLGGAPPSSGKFPPCDTRSHEPSAAMDCPLFKEQTPREKWRGKGRHSLKGTERPRRDRGGAEDPRGLQGFQDGSRRHPCAECSPVRTHVPARAPTPGPPLPPCSVPATPRPSPAPSTGQLLPPRGPHPAP